MSENEDFFKRYDIVRFYQDRRISNKVIKRNVTLAEAKEHCTQEDTRGSGWFDGYREN